MASSKDVFDITRLYKVLDANNWSEGKNYMKFWADGSAQAAINDPTKGKSTIGANLSNGLRIYTISWGWLDGFSESKSKYTEFLTSSVKTPRVQQLLVTKYGQPSPSPNIVTPFNDWLKDGISPSAYLPYIKSHQLQYIAVDSYSLNNNQFDDLVAALNGFNYFAFYKGYVISAAAYRTNFANCEKLKSIKPPTPKPQNLNCNQTPLQAIPIGQRAEIEKHIKDSRTKSVVCVTHVGIYAGDIYEFNGDQYLATWNLEKNTVNISYYDALFGSSKTDDPKSLTITNGTFNEYRKNTGMGGDFLALSPVRLAPLSLIIPVT